MCCEQYLVSVASEFGEREEEETTKLSKQG
jgi:hypothetical protein